MLVQATDDPTVLHVTAPPRLSSLVREVPGATWSAKAGKWRLPCTFNALIQLHGVTNGNVEFDPEVADRIAAWKNQEAELHAEHDKTMPHPFLYPFQVETLTRVLDASYMSQGGAILAAAPGTGKGHTLDTVLPTPQGFRRAGDVRVGDFLFGRDGSPVRVTGVHPRGVQPCFEVTVRGARPIVVDADHLWEVHRLDARPTVVRTADLKVTRGRGSKSLWVPAHGAVEFPEKDLPIPPYALGALIADGCLNQSTVQFTTRSEEFLENMKAQGLLVRSRSSEFLQHYVQTAHGMSLQKRLSALGLRVKSAQKHIPRVYLEASVAQRTELLHGLFDGDGHVRTAGGRGQAGYGTMSPQLADDVEELVQSLGGWVSRRWVDRDGVHWLRLAPGLNPFSLAAKRVLVSHKRELRRKFESVVPTKAQETVCFTVDAPDSLYLAPGYVPTHNTAIASAWLENVGAWGASVALVVAPYATHRGWLAWCEKTFPGRKHMRLPVSPATVTQRRRVLKEFTEAAEAGDAGVLIVTYSQLALHSRQQSYGSVRLKPADKEDKELNRISFDAVILDEAHRVTNPKAAQTRAAWYLAHHAQNRLIMTGTPCLAVPEVSVTRLLFAAFPKGWPSFTKLFDLYFDVQYNHWGGSEVIGLNPNTAAEYKRLRDLTMIQLPKEVALPDLDKILYREWYVSPSASQMKQYKELQREMVTTAESGEQVATFNAAVTHMRLCEAALAKLDTDDSGNVILCAPSPAIEALEDIRESLSEDYPILVFTDSRKLLDLAEKVLTTKFKRRVMTVAGGQSGPERDAAIDAYNHREVDYLLVSIGGSGGAADGWSGIGGHVSVFLSRNYRPEINLQAEDRLHGIGRGVQGLRTIVYDIVVEGTVMEERLDQLRGKLARGEEMLSDAQ